MARTQKSSAVIGLHLQKVVDGDYVHFNLHPVTIGRTPDELQALDRGEGAGSVHNDKVRNISCTYGWDTINGLDLSGLQISSQGGGCSTDTRLYGFEVEYRNVFSIDTAKAERIAKTLTTIRKRMEKLSDKVGRPKTFGQFVGHVAKAIGATKLVLVKNDNMRGGWDTADVSFRSFPTEAIDHIDYQVDQWANSRQKEPV